MQAASVLLAYDMNWPEQFPMSQGDARITSNHHDIGNSDLSGITLYGNFALLQITA